MIRPSFEESWQHDLRERGRTSAPWFLVASAFGLLLFIAYDLFSVPELARPLAVGRVVLSLVALAFAAAYRAGRVRDQRGPFVFLASCFVFFSWVAARIADPSALLGCAVYLAVAGCFWPSVVLAWSTRSQAVSNAVLLTSFGAFHLAMGQVTTPTMLTSGGFFLLFAAVASPGITAWRLRTMRDEARLRYELMRKTDELEASRAELAFQADHDAMTGVLNRRAGLEFLAKSVALARRQERSLSTVYVDVDDLKLVNDHLGHAAGDRLIATVSGLLREGIRSSDMVCRLGGDEFLVVLYDCRASDAEVVQRKWQARIEAFHAAAEAPFRLGISVGVADWAPGSPVDIDALLAQADQRMFAAKRARKGAASPRKPAAVAAN
jgi:diguanylate cyclase (GGDEF)-like protein